MSVSDGRSSPLAMAHWLATMANWKRWFSYTFEGMHHLRTHECKFVVGYHGRKGPKLDPTVMGTAVQYMGTNTAVPIFILKDPIQRKDKPDQAFRFTACCDGS